MAFSINDRNLGPILAIVAGVLILVVPDLLRVLLALYLIITGILGLTRHP